MNNPTPSWLQQSFSPLCLVLGLTLLIVGFSLTFHGMPEDNVQLHAARASGDRTQTEYLENALKRKQDSRFTLICLSFAASAGMFAASFVGMQRSRR